MEHSNKEKDSEKLMMTYILEILPGGLVRKVANVNVASTTGSETASTAGGLSVLADENHTTLDLGVGQGLDCLLGLLRGREFNDSASLGSAIALLHDITVNNLTGLTPEERGVEVGSESSGRREYIYMREKVIGEKESFRQGRFPTKSSRRP